MSTNQQGQRSAKGSADIVILLDLTGSMQACIDSVRENVGNFISFLSSPAGSNENPIRDWRLKICGYRDFEFDEFDARTGQKGPGWFVDNPFTRDVAQARKHLSAQNMAADGGGDDAESLLDALYKIGSLGEPSDSATEDANLWRPKKSATRIIIFFTDAAFKPEIKAPEGHGGGVDDVLARLSEKRIILCGFAPETDGYYDLASLDKAEIEFTSSLESLATNADGFQNILKQLAKTVSKSNALEFC
jgi:hypothetical protein